MLHVNQAAKMQKLKPAVNLAKKKEDSEEASLRIINQKNHHNSYTTVSQSEF